LTSKFDKASALDKTLDVKVTINSLEKSNDFKVQMQKYSFEVIKMTPQSASPVLKTQITFNL